MNDELIKQLQEATRQNAVLTERKRILGAIVAWRELHLLDIIPIRELANIINPEV